MQVMMRSALMQKAQQNVLQEDVRVKKSGYLVKEGGATVRNWRKRWFVMSGNAISYSKTEEDLASLGTIYLEDVAAVERTDERPLQQNVFALRGHDKARTWYLSAASEEEMVAWMDAIKQAIAEEEALRATAPSQNVFLTVECFANRGVRVIGLLPPQVLATISHGVSADKKRLDERGWYCEKHVPLCTLLNLLSAYGWNLVQASEGVSMLDDTYHPVNMVILSKHKEPEEPEVLQRPASGHGRRVVSTSKTRSMLLNEKEMAHVLKAMGIMDLLA